MSAFDGVLIGIVIACLICIIQIFPSEKGTRRQVIFILGACILLAAIIGTCVAAKCFLWESALLKISAVETEESSADANAKQTGQVDDNGMVLMPSVISKEQIEAIEILEQLGLQYQVWWTEENNIKAEHYYIIGQSISEGSIVPIGTLVKLELSPNEP